MNIELKDFELAAERLKPILHHTELDHSATFSAMTGGDIYLKCENRQKTGSFKIRGAIRSPRSWNAAGFRRSLPHPQGTTRRASPARRGNSAFRPR